MAKGSLFVGSGSGKVGNLVLANTKQGQVTRAYQPNVTNPKSRAQMLQRSRFADAVKFFKQATENFFKFAYEDKAKKESDYNAFMRHNIMKAIPMARDYYLNPTVPALGNVFQLSSGRLTNPLTLSFVANTSDAEGHPKQMPQFTLPSAAASSDSASIGKALIAAGLHEGDIITIVIVTSVVTFEDDEDLSAYDDTPEPPKWTIGQFVVSGNAEGTFINIPAIGSLAENGKLKVILSEDYTEFHVMIPEGKSVFASALVTRKLSDGLYASNSYLQSSDNIVSGEQWLTSDTAVDQALLSWGSKGSAILKGSVAGLK